MYNDKSYALITGASEGLGKYLAIECAKRKINLVVTALPGSGLINFSEYLIREFEVEVMAIEKDLSTESACHEIYSAIKERQITINILVNNAGVGGTFPFEQKDPWFLKKIIDLNVIAPTLLSKLFLNDLKLSSPSFIMNVSSLAGMFDLPGKQVYGGTKSYLISFSKRLRKELRGQVSVSVLCPGGMNTSWQLTIDNRITGTWLSRKSIMFPQEVAAIAVEKMFARKAVIVPGFWNKFFLLLNSIIPKRAANFLTEYQMKKTPWNEKRSLCLEPVRIIPGVKKMVFKQE